MSKERKRDNIRTTMCNANSSSQGGKMVNINREIVDSFYRYKMPLMTIKVEGRGNGIKTLITNMDQVGKSLARSSEWVIRYFAIELGVQHQMKAQENAYLVKGRFEAETFQTLLDKFIKNFVLCQECSNPETDIRVTSKSKIEQKCKACGYIRYIPQVHKLTKFIVKMEGGKKNNKNKSIEYHIQKTENVEEPDDEWDDEDFTPEAIMKRQKELGTASCLVQLDRPYSKDRLYQVIEKGIINDTLSSEIINEEMVKEGSKRRHLITSLIRIMSNSYDSSIRKYSDIFKNSGLDQEHIMKFVLSELEKNGMEETTVLEVLQALYDTEIIRKETMITWIRGNPDDIFRSIVEDFLDRIYQETNDDEIEFSTNVYLPIVKENEGDSNESDIDIDNI